MSGDPVKREHARRVRNLGLDPRAEPPAWVLEDLAADMYQDREAVRDWQVNRRTR